jgi:hypothetical protein
LQPFLWPAAWRQLINPSGTAKFVWHSTLCSEPSADNTTADSIEKILNLNQDPAQSTDGHTDSNTNNGLTSSSAPILNSEGDPIWKVLVFDDLGRDVISSVLRVNDLRAWGVTMHMYVKRSISGYLLLTIIVQSS